MQRLVRLAVIAVAAVAFGWYVLDQRAEDSADAPAGGGAMVQVTVPDLAGDDVTGKRAFDAKCADCHGPNAAGRDGIAPPLVHKTYEPSHHGDAAFFVAVRNGVRAHHWSFGFMPPVQGLSDAEIGMIVGYLRTLQRANGIN